MERNYIKWCVKVETIDNYNKLAKEKVILKNNIEQLFRDFEQKLWICYLKKDDIRDIVKERFINKNKYSSFKEVIDTFIKNISFYEDMKIIREPANRLKKQRKGYSMSSR